MVNRRVKLRPQFRLRQQRQHLINLQEREGSLLYLLLMLKNPKSLKHLNHQKLVPSKVLVRITMRILKATDSRRDGMILMLLRVEWVGIKVKDLVDLEVLEAPVDMVLQWMDLMEDLGMEEDLVEEEVVEEEEADEVVEAVEVLEVAVAALGEAEGVEEVEVRVATNNL